jgi:Fe-S cluster assembly protein SufD
MPANATISTVDRGQFDALLAGRNEPEWMTAQRNAAWTAFEAAEMPEWRRSKLKGFDFGNYSVAEATTTIEFAGAAGVVVLPLAEALLKHADLVQRVLGSGVHTDRDKFTALNNALINGGVFVYVPKNSEVEAPINIQYRVNKAGDLVAPRTLALVEPNSRIKIIEEYISDDFAAPALVLSGAEFEVGDGAALNYTWVQNLGANVTIIGGQQLNLVGKDAQGEWLNIVMGGTLQHVTLEAQMRGNGSSIAWNGVIYGNHDQNLLVAPTLNHIGLNTEGQINFKTVVDDNAYAVFDGMVRIPKSGQGTNSDLRENAMHLSKTSRSDSIPGLEIDANEVKAGHGSTSGQIDEEQLFYLQSRGLPFEEAKRTIVLGFVGEIIDMIPDEALRERIEEVVADKI